MDCIESVDELVKALKKSNPKDYNVIAKSLKIQAADLMEFAYWKEEGYARNCIERTSDFELLLLCWNPGDATPIHCHGEQRCWVYQVSGRLQEVIYKENTQNELNPIANQELKSGDIGYMEDAMGYHTLCNNSDSKSMSLHLYAKPIDSCTYYDKKVDKFVGSEMHYHSYKGKLVNHLKDQTRAEILSGVIQTNI